MPEKRAAVYERIQREVAAAMPHATDSARFLEFRRRADKWRASQGRPSRNRREW